MEKSTLDFMKNLKLTINRFHFRYEDDYFSFEKPYSFGIVVDVKVLIKLIYIIEICQRDC